MLLDGGLGQELIHRMDADVAYPLWSLQVMLDEPQLVADVHRDFCLAGANAVCLNTYCVTHSRLARDPIGIELAPALEMARTLAANGIRASGRTNICTLASLPPLVASFRSELVLSVEQMAYEYKELIELQSQHVDGFIAETLSCIDEGRAVINAARAAGLHASRLMISFTVDDADGTRLRSGEPLTEALKLAEAHKAAAILVNCSRPEAVTDSLKVLATGSIVFGAYANGFTSVDALMPGRTVDVLHARKDLTPASYAEYARQWLQSGAGVIGGCCEVGPAHIAAVRDMILTEGRTLHPVIPADSSIRMST